MREVQPLIECAVSADGKAVAAKGGGLCCEEKSSGNNLTSNKALRLGSTEGVSAFPSSVANVRYA